MRRKDGYWGAAIAFLAITVFRSLSKATILAFVLSEGYLIIQDKSMQRKTKIILAVLVGIAVLAFWGLFAAYYDIYTTAGNQAETLTGRTAIWAYVLSAGLEHPWLGHGLDSMWKVVPPFGVFEARHAENELLQQFYSYGIAGIAMLIGLYFSLHRQILGIADSPAKIIFLSALLYVWIRGLAEAEPFDLLFPLWAIFLISLLANKLRDSSRHSRVSFQQASG
jgi:O-antigen ligase